MTSVIEELRGRAAGVEPEPEAPPMIRLERNAAGFEITGDERLHAETLQLVGFLLAAGEQGGSLEDVRPDQVRDALGDLDQVYPDHKAAPAGWWTFVLILKAALSSSTPGTVEDCALLWREYRWIVNGVPVDARLREINDGRSARKRGRPVGTGSSMTKAGGMQEAGGSAARVTPTTSLNARCVGRHGPRPSAMNETR